MENSIQLPPMKPFQRPHKITARSAWNRNRKLKDFSKVTKKCLNAEFTSVSEDSVDFSPTSEITNANRNEDITAPCDIIMPSKINTNEAGITSNNCFDAYKLNSSAFTSVEANIAPNSLRNAQPETLKSLTDAPQYRKLMEEITEYVMADLSRNILPEEDLDIFVGVLSVKNRMIFLCFCIWIIGVSAVLLLTSDFPCCAPSPPPT